HLTIHQPIVYAREKDSQNTQNTQNTQNVIPPPDPIIPNGSPQVNSNYEKKPCSHRGMTEQPDVAEHKNQITILKQKIDESERFLQSKKRRLYWTAGGFAVGAVAATAVGLLAGEDMREMLNGLSESVGGMIQF